MSQFGLLQDLVWSQLLKGHLLDANLDRYEKFRLQFQSYFQLELEFVNEVWAQRASSFAFLESCDVTENTELAFELLQLMRLAEQQVSEIQELNQARENEKLAPLLPEYASVAHHLEELIFIEQLCDTGLLMQISDLLQQNSEQLLTSLFQLIHEELRQFEHSYRSDLSSSQKAQQCVSLLAYPCTSCYANLWVNHFDQATFDFMVQPHHLVDDLLDRVYQKWTQLWQVHTWNSNIQWNCPDDKQDAKQAEVFLQVWTTLFDPFLKELATHSVKCWRDQDIIKDLEKCFSTLIDAKRPKDQRIGSFWFNEEEPNEITVMFITRDGKLLAQRDIKWNSQNAESILSAFDEINIRLLTFPAGLEKDFPEAFELLAQKYQLTPVSSIVLDPVPHPLNLSDSAQKALRIGQRFVAPLRFWARTNLTELMKCFASSQMMACLEESGRWNDLHSTLQDACAERWLRLRKRREKRNKKSNEKVKQTMNDISVEAQKMEPTKLDEEQSFYSRGNSLQAEIIEIDGYWAMVTLDDNQTQAKVRLKRPRQFQVGQKIQVTVLGLHPKTQEISLSLKRAARSQSTQKDQGAIKRLNKLFSNK